MPHTNLMQMEKLKQTIAKLPEYYFLAAALLYGFSLPFHLNPIAIGLILVFILQIIFKNNISGIIIASLILAINFYMLLALVSEFNEFPDVNADARKLIGIGLLFFFVNLLMTVVMIVKYARKGNITTSTASKP